MNILSLFDGISAGRLALERAGVPVKAYYASEIDKYAIAVTQKNYPDTIQIGDVTKVMGADLPKIDILIGGSPCTGFSFAGKQLNFEDRQSKLFFEYVRLLRELKPKYFLLENVKMKKEYEQVITDILGVEPINICSSLLSAQRRKRLYWTNIPEIEVPKDKSIMLEDIILERTNPGIDIDDLKVPLDKSFIILDKEVQKGKVGYFRKDCQANRVYYVHGKAVTLCGEAGGGAAKMGQYLFGCITPDRLEKRQNGQRFSIGKKSYTLTAQDKHGILTEGYIRKLHPIECERLQTFPDNWTESISNSQRYKCLGNSWTVDVIAHIFKNMPC